MSTDLGVRRPADRRHDWGASEQVLVPSPVAQALSGALAVAALSAALTTVLLDGVLHGPPAMNGSARGTALVMAALGVPLLLVAQAATRRGSTWALPVWLGAISYLLYNAFMLLFATPFNSLFLLYVATFSLALWSLVAVLRVVDVAALGARIAPGVPRRAIAVFVWVLVALNAAAWLRGIVTGMSQGADPEFLAGTGLTTFPTYVQDLAVWLPLLAVAGCWLWRGLAWGYLVVASVLVMWVVEAITIAVDQYMATAADPATTVASAAAAPVFAVVAVLCLVPATAMIRRM
jgi:hypothetical protein